MSNFTFLGSASGVGSVTANTTGAKLIVILTSGTDGAGPTENKGNTISAPAAQSDIAGGSLRISYISNPTSVGAGHVFGVTGSYGAVGVMWFSGVAGVPAASGHNESNSALTLQLAGGAITPAADDALAIWAGEFGNTFSSIDSGFVSPNSVAVTGVYATNYGLFGGYKMMPTATAINPTITETVPASRMQFAMVIFGPPAPAATVTNAAVAANGKELVLTFSGTVATPSVAVKASGIPVSVAAVSGSGNTWTLNFGRRWINQADSIVVTYGGVDTLATNGSQVKGSQIKHVGRNFTMFIHWNNETFNDTGLGTGLESPNTFQPTGNPTLFIRQWGAACKLAGMQSAALTVKHHSGFCLWPSAASAYNLSASSWWVPAGRPDIVKIFVDEFRAAGLGVEFYFSIKDFHFESITPGVTSAQYTAFVVSQITELLTNYGPIDTLWLDGFVWYVPYSTVPWEAVKAVRDRLQPMCMFVSNSYETDLAHTDILSWEFPAQANPALGNKLVGDLCDTIYLNSRFNNFDWFFRSDSYLGLTAQDIRDKVAYHNANNFAYRLNCGPDTTGYMPANVMARLADVGATSFEVRNDPSASVVSTNPIAVGVDILTGRLVIPA